MKFLIVSPRFIVNRYDYYNFPIGLAYISSSLKVGGYDVECLNLNHYSDPVDILLTSVIQLKNIDCVCVGGLSPHYNKIKEIISAAKNAKHNIKTIVGGGVITSEPILVYNALNVDFGVIGEGDRTIVELADALVNNKNVSTVNGIVYRDINQKIVQTQPREAIMDLDSLPFPDYEGFEYGKYLDSMLPSSTYYLYTHDKPRELPIISSRSCPYNCTFCFHPLGKKYRHRSLDSFFKEIDLILNKHNINIMTIYDELFASDKNRIHEFCKRIKPYNLKWILQLRVDSVDKEILNLMRDCGCFNVSYGLESANNNILKSMKKNITISQIENALKLTEEFKIGIQGNFIFGDSVETKETYQDTLNWWLKNLKYSISLVLIRLYPGTELYKRAIKNSLIEDPIKFIEDECPETNVSKLTTREYEILRKNIHIYSLKFKYRARKISRKKLPKDIYGRVLYSLKLECPFCKSKIDYNNMEKHHDQLAWFKVGCRECNQRFDIPYNTVLYDLYKILFNNYLVYTLIRKIYRFIRKN